MKLLTLTGAVALGVYLLCSQQQPGSAPAPKSAPVQAPARPHTSGESNLDQTAVPIPNTSEPEVSSIPSQATEPMLAFTNEAAVQPPSAAELASTPVAEIPALLGRLCAANADPEQTNLARGLIQRWAAESPKAAGEWISQQTGPFRAEALQILTESWAATNPGEALQWADSINAADAKAAAIMSVARETAVTDPVGALNSLVSLPLTPDSKDLLVYAAGNWAAQDLQSAVDWAGSVEDSSVREPLLTAIAVAAAQEDAAGAATLIATRMSQGEEQDRAAILVARRWAQSAPDEAALWLLQFPESPARNAATHNLLELWAGKDREAARNWVHSLPEGDFKSAGLDMFNQIVSRSADTSEADGSPEPMSDLAG